MARCVLVIVWMVVSALLTGAASAETLRIPLPDLVGSYVVDDLSLALFAQPDPVTTIDRSLIPPGAVSYRLEWSGTLTAGHIVGDGATRAPVEALLQASFIPNITGPAESFGRFGAQLPALGPFEDSWQLGRLPGQFVDWNDIGGAPPPAGWSVSLKLVPDYQTLGNAIPFLSTSPNGQDASDGLILLEPIQADVTAAALVIEVIPEPATLVIAAVAVLLGAVFAVRRQPC